MRGDEAQRDALSSVRAERQPLIPPAPTRRFVGIERPIEERLTSGFHRAHLHTEDDSPLVVGRLQHAEAKIEQLYGDSKSFDASPYAERCDLVFVDGSHAYTYVKNDSEKAFAILRPGGIVLWHDYHGPRRAPGVWRALNELSRDLDLVHIAGTSLVAYRKPKDG